MTDGIEANANVIMPHDRGAEIDWDIQSSQDHSQLQWTNGSNQNVHIRTNEITNGMIYAEVVDNEGNRIYDSSEKIDDISWSSPQILNSNPEIGNGWKIGMLSAGVSSAEGEESENLTHSYIEKIVSKENPKTDERAQHKVTVGIELSQKGPSGASLRAVYESPSEICDVFIPAHPDSGRLWAKVETMDPISGDDIAITFGTDGLLQEMHIASTRFRGKEGAEGEMLPMTETDRRFIFTLTGQDLNSNLAKSVIRSIFGVTYDRDLHLDRASTIAKQTTRLDERTLTSPREALVFTNATNLPEGPATSVFSMLGGSSNPQLP